MRWSRKTIGLGSLAVLALALRVWLVFALTTSHADPVSYEHGRIAANLLAGRGFTIEFLGTEGRTSQQAPFYPTLLTVAYGCLGVDTPAAILAVQLLQCVAGAGLVLAVVWLVWSLVPDQPGAGWLAGLGAAVYPPHVYMATHLQVAPWAALVLTVLLGVVVSARWRATWRGAVLAGVLSGLLLLTEPILALALPIGALAFWLGHRAEAWKDHLRPVPLGRVAVMAAVATVVVAPWLIRNCIVHGEFVFIKSTFGYAFWQANNPISWGTDKIPKDTAEGLRLANDGTLASVDRALWDARHETLYIDDVLLKPTGYREFAGLGEPARSRLLGQRAWKFIRTEPAHYGRLCLQRLRYFLLFDETNPKAANQVYRISTVVWLVLSTIGLMVTWRRWRAFWPTYATFALVTLFHSLVITSARFRIPVEPLSFVWAATAIAPLLVHFQWRRPTEACADPPASASFGPLHALKGPHWKPAATRRESLASEPDRVGP
jgi:4-amino-4-deoxy-L-arabinose transferase-like glycosyltransferase